jgi:predicted homoserine dehydrogenase-like protein
MSVSSAALRGESTGQPQGWRGDVAVAKRYFSADEALDSEGARRLIDREFTGKAVLACRLSITDNRTRATASAMVRR